MIIINLLESPSMDIVNQKGMSRLVGWTLCVTLFINFNTVHGNPVHQLDHSSCSSFCGDHYHSLTEWTSCARGCRFFSLIQILAKPQSLDSIEKSCITTCNETYNEIQLRKSCSSGCKKSIEMINNSKNGHTDHHQSLHSAEQWIHHLGMSPFEDTLESSHREFVWPFHFFNDIYKQLTDQLASSTNWIKSRSSYTLLFGDSSNGRQIFLVRARPHLTINSTPTSSLSHSSLSINPIHEQSTFHVIAFPSSSSSSLSHPIKPIKLTSSSSSSIIAPLSRNHQTDQSQTFTRWITDTSSTIFKDLRLLMALLLAIVVLSIVTFSEALCWTVDGRNKDTQTQPPSSDGETEVTYQEKNDPNESSPFFILNSSRQSKEAEANGTTIENVKQEESIEAETEQPPTYDETVKTSQINFESLTSSRESKA